MYNIYLYDQVVGRLVPRGSGVQFTYDPGVIDDDTTPAISLSMPKRSEVYGGRVAKAFFLNLLPEGAYKRLVAGTSGTSLESDQALLGAIGGECPGAISIWPETETLPSTPDYEPMTSAELKELFNPSNPTAIATAVRRARLSLAGAQEKIALYADDSGNWFRPINGAITSHILKQSAVGYGGLLENELFCMTLAADSGLVAAKVGLAAPEVRVFCTLRFDRLRTRNGLHQSEKLHQEDFCQILSVLPEKKYEDEGGPSLKDCARVLRDSSALPIDDLIRLLRWIGFNYLIGNEDAHAKNLALLYHDDGLRLAPHYDLLSTEVYSHLERHCAMKIGRATDIRAVQASDWVRIAEILKVPWPTVRDVLQELTDRVLQTLHATTEKSADMFGRAVIYDQILGIIRMRCGQMVRELVRRN